MLLQKYLFHTKYNFRFVREYLEMVQIIDIKDNVRTLIEATIRMENLQTWLNPGRTTVRNNNNLYTLKGIPDDTIRLPDSETIKISSLCRTA